MLLGTYYIGYEGIRIECPHLAGATLGARAGVHQPRRYSAVCLRPAEGRLQRPRIRALPVQTRTHLPD